VYVDVSCYGGAGPWRGRAGGSRWRSPPPGSQRARRSRSARLVPRHPATTSPGTWVRLEAMAALRRRGRKAGLQGVGVVVSDRDVDPVARRGPPTPARPVSVIGSRTAETATVRSLRHLLPVAEMSRTAPHWDLPPAPIGTHAAEWSDG
jgi:hypothetical protein